MLHYNVQDRIDRIHDTLTAAGIDIINIKIMSSGDIYIYFPYDDRCILDKYIQLPGRSVKNVGFEILVEDKHYYQFMELFN